MSDTATGEVPEKAAPAPEPAKAGGNQLDDALQELRDGAPHMAGLPGVGSKQAITEASAVWQIELDLQIVLGSTAMSVSDLLKLEAGGRVMLDQSAEQPLELAVNGRTIGYGELVDDPAGGLAIRILRLTDLGPVQAASDVG